MGKTKSLQELTLKDNFMFGAVMMDPENCKEALERSLDIEIERVEWRCRHYANQPLRRGHDTIMIRLTWRMGHIQYF